jgi:hypothetical protein
LETWPKNGVRTFNVGFGVLRIKTAHCISVVGASLVGTKGSTSRTFVDGTCSMLGVGTDGGGSANSVVDVSTVGL